MARRNRKVTPLLKVVREAKKIARRHPTWSWKRCLKEGGKRVRKKKR